MVWDRSSGLIRLPQPGIGPTHLDSDLTAATQSCEQGSGPWGPVPPPSDPFPGTLCHHCWTLHTRIRVPRLCSAPAQPSVQGLCSVASTYAAVIPHLRQRSSRIAQLQGETALHHGGCGLLNYQGRWRRTVAWGTRSHNFYEAICWPEEKQRWRSTENQTKCFNISESVVFFLENFYIANSLLFQLFVPTWNKNKC